MIARLTCLLGATALMTASAARAQDLLYELPQKPLGLGPSLLAVDDLDGDGLRDLAVSNYADLLLFSGASGQHLKTLSGVGGFASIYSEWIADAGDVDGDGLRDVATRRGVYSLASGAQLLALPNSVPYAQSGPGLGASGLGDIDGDGMGDLLFGNPQVNVKNGGDVIKITATGPGYVQLLSGATGALLWQVDGDHSADGFGAYVTSAGDVDGDGLDDALVSTRLFPAGVGQNYVRILSGADGALLLEVALAQTYLSADGAVARVGDVDGDGAPDFALGEANFQRVRLISSASGATLWSDEASGYADQYGFDVRSAGDVDGDGLEDVLVLAPQTKPVSGGAPGTNFVGGPGFVRLLSGASGTRLNTFVGYEVNGGFGSGMAGLGDLDGDGLSEVALGAPWEGFVAPFGPSGIVRVFRGAAGFSVPSTWCVGVPTVAAPRGAKIGGQGSLSAAASDFELTVIDAAPAALGFFLYAEHQAAISMGFGYPPPFLCLQAPLQRVLPGLVTGASGVAKLPLDLGAPGSPFQTGSTWHFQFAWRDGANFATSNALSLTVQP